MHPEIALCTPQYTIVINSSKTCTHWVHTSVKCAPGHGNVHAGCRVQGGTLISDTEWVETRGDQSIEMRGNKLNVNKVVQSSKGNLDKGSKIIGKDRK